MANKPPETLNLPATLKPGDFPLGSAESRAAARMLAQQRETQGKRLEIILSSWMRPARGNDKPHATPWIPHAFEDGTLVRTLVVPEGMSAEEARRIVDRRNV
jgi:hypothetical protein